MTNSEIQVGDRVLLQLGVDGERYAPPGLKRWDGCRFRVDKVHVNSQGEVTYELKSCKSVLGVPYTILEEWITPTR